MSTPRVSSALKAVELKQEPAPLIIGERINTQGSRKAKKLVLEDDYDGLLDLARTQVEDGAHCLDVCVATTERSDEKSFMLNLVKRLSLEIDAPLVIDSTDPEVIESAVIQIPGKPVINSINLEGDGSRFEKLAPIMAKYGLPAVALCIGPNGMAKTPQQKLETAELLYETGKKYGLREDQFIFDVLTFTLATGEDEFLDAGKNTLEGIRLVKERFPKSFTTLGLSNISFGLVPYARKILNSVFLYHAVKSGLDTAIVNAKEIIPYGEIDEKERKLAEDLVFNSHPNALSELISYFEKAGPQAGKESKKVDVDPSWPAGKRANFRIVNRLKDGIEKDVVYAIAEKLGKNDLIKETGDAVSIDASQEITHDGAIKTLNEDLLPAMKEVGDKFGSGELILPFVLKSAECMKAAVGELEKYLLQEEGTTKGKLVLGTVYGDVHDIGKNLVKTIFQNNGYTVYDLGKQVPLQKFLEKIDEVKPDAIGLSALLVSTSKQMQFFVEHARKNNMDIPILCGGAAINSNYINRIAKQDGLYESGVFYCNTMFEGLKTMDRLVSDKEILLQEWKEKLEKWKETTPTPSSQTEGAKSAIVPVTPPTPPRINIPIHLDESKINVNEVWEMIDKKSLFKLSWGLRGKAGQDQEEEHEKLFQDWKKRIEDENLFEPSAVYGYFNCHGENNKLTVDHPAGEKLVFDLPRSTKPKHLCLADYFGKDDIVAFQAVTVGNKVADIIEQWNKEDKYADAYYLHGLAVEFAEGMAAWINQKIKSELAIKEKGGLRYSWGYPSCPDVGQHHLVWKLLNPEKYGMTLTESGQIVPEQSTAAIVVHHPDAEYFVL
ncbi:MAG: dihydropteroate synthase [Nitrosopumilus sp.]|uniref:Dihydropteroate synthase n=2 Tax=Candidatus Nitrosomaritimum aestuariumsis TaxID=3342354 RepID=A0AC60W887_9ARCH|nr:dihydropteroate synthase [Nitrosopumilaceae archaeon]